MNQEVVFIFQLSCNGLIRGSFQFFAALLKTFGYPGDQVLRGAVKMNFFLICQQPYGRGDIQVQNWNDFSAVERFRMCGAGKD